ncbi:foldase protein PrsA [Allosphingosinicella sp.]|uniref:peptidylprolyl isomerase n=1 Tax=Allosphingosinicella sp. TaxID=2823234 RepID=UPI003D746894
MKLGTLPRAALALAASLLSVMAAAQTSGPARTGLSIPENIEFMGRADPNVRKATAIVNGEVITESDIDHRLALVEASQQIRIPAEELPRIRAQILRNIIDETLQIQAAAQRELTIEQREINGHYTRIAERMGHTQPAFAAFLRSIGSSERSMKRQIHAELAWARLQSREIAPFVNVGDEEVQAVINRLTASRGTREFRVSEIFLSATQESAAEVRTNAARIVEQIRNGASFPAYARQFSEASTAAVGGDLGWVRAELLPDPLAAALPGLRIGMVSDPIPVSGGFSIVVVTDTRQILTPDARDALLSLMQVSVRFPAGTTEEQARPAIERLVQTTQTMGGCGGAPQAAAAIGAEVVSNDQVAVRELPGPLQEMLLGLNIGQATRPFGSLQSQVSVLVLCGRDDPQTVTGPSFEQVFAQINDERVNRRAQRFLRDLRRDAVIDYR